MQRRIWLTAAVVLAVAVVATAVRYRGGREPEVATGPVDTSDDSIVVQLLKDPKEVPAFTVTDLSGKPMSSADWRGKVVLINFWATWCAPCLAEIPDLIALQEKYRDHLIIVGISEDEASPEVVKRFATERKMNYPIAMATPEVRGIFPGIVALPTTFMLDPEGRMVKKQVGLLNAKQTEATTRVLAGLNVRARVERVDDPGRLTAENAAQLKEIPGVDLSRVPPEHKAAVLQALNGDKCTCGCDLSVAKCRIDDPHCDVSLPVARKIVEKFAKL